MPIHSANTIVEKREQLDALDSEEVDNADQVSKLESEIKKAEKIVKTAARALGTYERVVLKEGESLWATGSAKDKETQRLKAERDLEETRSTLEALIISRTALKYQLHHEGTLDIKLTTRIQNQIHNVKADAEPHLDRYRKACIVVDVNPTNCKKYNEICRLNDSFWTNSVSFNIHVLHQYSNKLRAIEKLQFVREEEARLKTYVESARTPLEIAIESEPIENGYRQILFNRLVRIDTFWSKVNDGRIPPSVYIRRPRSVTIPKGKETDSNSGSVEGNIEDDLLEECDELPATIYEDIENNEDNTSPEANRSSSKSISPMHLQIRFFSSYNLSPYYYTSLLYIKYA